MHQQQVRIGPADLASEVQQTPGVGREHDPRPGRPDRVELSPPEAGESVLPPEAPWAPPRPPPGPRKFTPETSKPDT